jgi:cytochrome c
MLILTAACIGAAPALAVEGNARRGQWAFVTQCATCHAVTPQPLPGGPHLVGIVGRRAATVSDFAFSEALKKSDIVWDEAALDRYLAAPEKTVPGTTMTVAVNRPATRADLIAYLKTLAQP